MEKKIVVPIDYSEVSKEIALFADEWAERTSGELYFLHVSPLPEYSYYPGYIEHLDYSKENHALPQLKNYLEDLELNSSFQTFHEYGSPYLKIVELVESVNADLVIMAAHSHTLLGRLFMGSNTDYVVHHVHCPLYISKKTSASNNKIILVPLDFSESNRLELNEEEGLELMEKFLAPIKITVPEKRVVLFGSSSYLRILDYQIEVQAGILMLAGHDHSIAGRFFLGSNTDYLLHHLDIPMYIYKSK